MTAVWTLVLVAAVALAYVGMWRGWHHRVARQSDLAEPQWVEDGVDGWAADVVAGGAAGGAAGGGPVQGTYVSTTTASHWMDRIAAHGLGTVSKAGIVADRDSLLVLRRDARGFRIPAQAVLGVRRTRGIAGKVRNRDGIVVVTWRLGGRELDTGFRPDVAREGQQLEATVDRLMRGADHG